MPVIGTVITGLRKLLLKILLASFSNRHISKHKRAGGVRNNKVHNFLHAIVQINLKSNKFNCTNTKITIYSALVFIQSTFEFLRLT